MPFGDAAKAEAIRVAYENHLRMGWSFSVSDIGLHAAFILIAMEKRLEEETKTPIKKS